MNKPIKAPKVILTVGNSMMGDDGAGPLLADLMEKHPIEGWVVINGGSAPENVSYQVRELNPECVVIVDAADIGLLPGEIRVIDPDYIAEMFIMSTHNMPLNFLIDQLKDDIPDITFLGIQPDLVGFYYPMTDAVKQAVDKVYEGIKSWRVDYFPPLEVCDEDDIELS
ncbi:hydrogenase maturation peptidase HycI [Proteus myxofaciens]|uniref:Coenzyme F420 hydrogenase maturation protease n=1 Tax=Proteus myxofaciens ATCC 19692 TaxID=1354337 RepID=A0A198G7T1_9GAMM|nr:hydrogenase maturation peptidase HycI [Proteus myxofaciens]OAT33158.1 coenzyme F420 hydrogenase maturation protease [Proteus myxofaciens ATCC 19692]